MPHPSDVALEKEAHHFGSECQRDRSRKAEADVVSREELYELVWSVPMVRVAEQFKVSGSYMARVCSALHVPRPERGYWAKLAVGKAPKSPHCLTRNRGTNLAGPKMGDCSRHLDRMCRHIRHRI